MGGGTTSDERTIEFRNNENVRRGGGGFARTTVVSPSSSSSGSSGVADVSKALSVAESVSMSSSLCLPAAKDHLRGGIRVRFCGIEEVEFVADESLSVPSSPSPSPSSSSTELSIYSICLSPLLEDEALQNSVSSWLGCAGLFS